MLPRKTDVLRGEVERNIKTRWFPDGTDIRSFVIHPEDEQIKRSNKQIYSVNTDTILFLVNTVNLRQIKMRTRLNFKKCK